MQLVIALTLATGVLAAVSPQAARRAGAEGLEARQASCTCVATGPVAPICLNGSTVSTPAIDTYRLDRGVS